MHAEAQAFIESVMPHNARKLKLYKDETPLFSRYQIESQIESVYDRELRLPSGGAIVIDHTEALVSIDINSARSTKGADIEETALNTNLEAADEIARQLRVRDLGGLFVIDFIDMGPSKHQRQVENRLRDALKEDRARVQVGRISRFGLLEMSRQRLRPSLGESTQHVCPRCEGHGFIRGVESLALSILRVIEEHAMKENTGRVTAQLPVDVATFLLNEKRQAIYDIEKRQDIEVILVPNQHMETPHYSIERVRSSDMPQGKDEKSSYQLVEEPEAVVPESKAVQQARIEQPAVRQITPPAPVPVPKEPLMPPSEDASQSGFLKRIFGLFAAPKAEEESTEKPEKREEKPQGKSRQTDHQKAQQANGRKRGPGQRSRSTSSQRKSADSSKQEGDKQQQRAEKSAGQDEGQEQKPRQQKSSGRGRRGGRRTSSGRQAPRQRRSDDNRNQQQSSDAQKQEGEKADTQKPSSRTRRRPRPEQKPESGEATQKAVAQDKGSAESKPKQSDQQKPAAAQDKPVTQAAAPSGQEKPAPKSADREKKPEPAQKRDEAPVAAKPAPAPSADKKADAPASEPKPKLQQVETKKAPGQDASGKTEQKAAADS
jgi:ribonuclease E